MNLRVYTDGASCGTTGDPGGWAAVLVFPEDDERGWLELGGGEEHTTNQRMEIMGAIGALEHVSQLHDVPSINTVAVYSDSAYLINCMNQRWFDKWLGNGWRNSQKERVANVDLWQRLIAAIGAARAFGLRIEWVKVKGHTKATHDHAVYNAQADRRAVAEKRKIVLGVPA